MSTLTFGTPQTNPFGIERVWNGHGYSSPTLADIDGDGDLDLFLGKWDGDLIYQENQGTASAPTFGTPKNNPFGITRTLYSSKPTFADLDGDGDLDIWMGEYHGNFMYQENQGTASSPTFGTPQYDPFGLADVGNYSSPTLADLDGDGLLDLLVGNSDGKIIYFKNKSPLVEDDTTDSSTDTLVFSQEEMFATTSVEAVPGAGESLDLDVSGNLGDVNDEITNYPNPTNSGISAVMISETVSELGAVGEFNDDTSTDIRDFSQEKMFATMSGMSQKMLETMSKEMLMPEEMSAMMSGIDSGLIGGT
ncbi:MAG: VCBS repeat-containing protein [Hormoscilla sp. GM7CHS1pb]|nr:VCBS repeat-containing protein [Hormoscilla sp. GM7CHS1pb]